MIASTLLVIGAISNPYREGFGGLRPTAMERTLDLLEQAGRVADSVGTPPCDADGTARRG